MSWNNQSKHSSTFTLQSKHSDVFSNSKISVNGDKLLLENGYSLLLENGGHILLNYSSTWGLLPKH